MRMVVRWDAERITKSGSKITGFSKTPPTSSAAAGMNSTSSFVLILSGKACSPSNCATASKLAKYSGPLGYIDEMRPIPRSGFTAIRAPITLDRRYRNLTIAEVN